MKSAFFYLLLLASMVSYAQKGSKAIITADMPPAAERIPVPYAGVQVIDARFDQSKIGCLFNRITPFDFSMYVFKRDAVFPDALTTYLPRFLETFLQTDNSQPDELMVLVKRFRIADYCSYGEANNADVDLTLNLSLSFYALHNERYYKLFSVDKIDAHTIYSIGDRTQESLQEDTRAMALRDMLYKLLSTESWVMNPASPSYTAADVASALEKRFALPVYDAVAKAGLYKNFSEFKNNAPSTTNISVIYKNGRIAAVRDKRGRPIDLRDYWGLADGNKRYMIFRDEPVELAPCDKSFKVRSYRTMSDTRKAPTASIAAAQYGMMATSLAKSLETMRTSEYFDLDMDSGDLYLEEMFGMPSTASIHKKILK